MRNRGTAHKRVCVMINTMRREVVPPRRHACGSLISDVVKNAFCLCGKAHEQQP
jgi:hypothetical protein